MNPNASQNADKAIITLEGHLGEINALNDFLKQKLTKDQDWAAYAFGGSKPRPTLLKGGAEKVARLIGVNQTTFDVSIHEDAGAFSVSVICKMQSPSGSCQGVGYANALESKWAKFDTSTKAYTIQPNSFNTVLKIAKKRAYVDCVLTMAGLSGYFTQDLEDMDGATKSAARTAPATEPGQKTTRTTKKTSGEKIEPVQIIDEDTGEITEEDGVTSWDDLVSDSTPQEPHCSICGGAVSEKVEKYSTEKFGRIICYKCQQTQKGA